MIDRKEAPQRFPKSGRRRRQLKLFRLKTPARIPRRQLGEGKRRRMIGVRIEASLELRRLEIIDALCRERMLTGISATSRPG